jgi:acyl-CoA synthetase (AMP-forming)/AMP-acid ligase II
MARDTNPQDRYGTIPQMVRTSAARFGDRDAVVDGESRLSFVEVEHGMMAVARSLIAAGIEPGDRVAVWAPNSATWITAGLGILATGAWLVPLNTRLKGEEAAFILDKTDARLLFAPREFLGTDYVSSLRAAAPGLRALEHTVDLPLPGEVTGREWEEFLGLGDAVPPARAYAVVDVGERDDVSDVIFTSGTTGTPKGVMLRHGASLYGYEMWSEAFDLQEHDRYVIPTPFFHCFGYKAGWMIGLMKGAVTFPIAVFEPDAVLDLIQRERITHVPGPPTMFSALLDHPRRDDYDLSTLRQAIVGAATISPVLVRRMRDELGIDSILAAYGLTENHALVSVTAPDDPPEIVATTVGHVLPDVELRIVDDDGHDAPPGEPGELWVRGPFLMTGYYDDAEATSSTIVDGWLHTGDVGVLDADGSLRITDRKKDMFIVGGFNVAPAEVEKALCGMAAIAQVAVVGIPDDYFGEVGAAFVIPATGVELAPDDVQAYAREHLANFKVPRRVILVEEFPVNATGKVLKNELRAQAQALLQT